MCTFLNSLPTKSRSLGTAQKKRKNLALSMRVCPDKNGEKTWYRFRLLNFSSKDTTRDSPWIVRYVHTHWKTNEKGYPEVDAQVVCPVTKWMDWEGDRYSCPICKYAGQQYAVLKESGFTDADARKKNRDFSRKLECIVPVYVVNDPNYEGNNGKFRVIIFNDKKVFEDFEARVRKQLMKANCFNGVDAVDCCMHVAEKQELRNEGKPNQYVYKSKYIDKIVFSNTPKNIAAITKEAVDAFPYDQEFYTASTTEEISEFYNKYIKVSNDDIVEDEEDTIKVYDEPKAKSKPVEPIPVTNAAVENDNDISDDDLNALTSDVDATPSNADDIPMANVGSTESDDKVETNADSSDDTSDDEMKKMLADLGL